MQEHFSQISYPTMHNKDAGDGDVKIANIGVEDFDNGSCDFEDIDLSKELPKHDNRANGYSTNQSHRNNTNLLTLGLRRNMNKSIATKQGADGFSHEVETKENQPGNFSMRENPFNFSMRDPQSSRNRYLNESQLTNSKKHEKDTVHEGEKQFAIDLSNASQAKGFSAAILARELD
jgi:hypothetical protein